MATLIDATTIEAIDYVNDNLNRLGKISSVIHRRNSNKINYETIIEGEYMTLHIHSGFSSGYVGEGSRGLAGILEKLGFDKEEVDRHVFSNTDNVYEFKLKKIIVNSSG